MEVKLIDLKKMSDAPRDRIILAYHKDGKFFHPVRWRDLTWTDGGTANWSVHWNEDYRQCDGDFLGWVEYPELVSG